VYTRGVRGEHIGRILDLRELGPLRRPEIVVVGMPKKSQASNPSASPRVGLDSLLQFCPQVFHPSSPGLLVHDLLEETSPWDPASADRLPVRVCSTFPRCYTLEMRGVRGSDVVLRDGEPAVSDQRNTFSIKCVSQPSPKNLGGLTTVAPVLFGKPFDGIVAVLTILRGDIGEVTLRVELLNFALFPTNAVVSFVLQPGPLIVVIVHFVNSGIFRASPSTMGSRDTTYTTAAGKWRRCDFVEVVSVHDTAIASFPTNFLASCGDNTWSYILGVINLVVDADTQHPGVIYDTQHQTVDLGSAPFAGGTFRFLEQGMWFKREICRFVHGDACSSGKNSDIVFARGPQHFSPVVAPSGMDSTTRSASSKATHSRPDQVFDRF